MGNIASVFVQFGFCQTFLNGLITKTEVPLYEQCCNNSYHYFLIYTVCVVASDFTNIYTFLRDFFKFSDKLED